jgi:hypothetical protein
MTDTINNMIIKGNYGEVFQKLDSAFVTKKAVAISKTENDSLYIHGDILLLTGKPENRILRAFNHVKFFKSDLSGKCDSLHSNQKTGLMKLFKKPVIWSENGQITGKYIHLLSNSETEKLDSLKVLEDAFLIQQDSIDGFNQIKGRNMFAKFKENTLETVDFIGNGEILAYLREEESKNTSTDSIKSAKEKIQTLFGISKTTGSKIHITFENKKIKNTLVYKQETQTYPPSKIPENARKLKDFIWREDERPKVKEDIFIRD